ncbi:aldose epimerase family protein [Alteribacillus sp. HJP-4]|uniref:aldose epimerase family protein n=1 Tax=Alteribacillus sp. HJP-4 TaxID=2775394 RepID=UPI0035CCD4A4
MIKEEQIDLWNGHPLMQVTLENKQGMRVEAINYGCRITGLYVPDRNGVVENVVLGYKDAAEYQTDPSFFGAVVGRVAGRIPNGRMQLNDENYPLVLSEGNHHLHGGEKGYGKVMWNVETEQADDASKVHFTYHSPDKEQGYPGAVEVKVTYSLGENGTFSILYDGISDQDTWLSLTNHSYFNLSGSMKRSVEKHELNVPVESIFELDSELIPTGQVLAVENTPYDVRGGKRLAEAFQQDHPQIAVASGGFDHFFIFEKETSQPVVLKDKESGRVMTMRTTEPGAVIYTANKTNNSLTLKDGPGFRYAGICLETQRLPEMFRHLERPTCFLKAGERYHAETSFTFTVE